MNNIKEHSSHEEEIPEHLKKLKTLSSIPQHMKALFPPKMAFTQDNLAGDKDSNPAYERMQRIKDKREIENAIKNINETD